MSGNLIRKGSDYKRDQIDALIKGQVDSLIGKNGYPSSEQSIKSYDIYTITSSFLIKNIEFAFKVWEMPWASHVSFQNFCEYILPYRIHDEPLSNWRELFYDEFISFADSVYDTSDPKQLIEKISNYIYSKWTHLDNFNSFGFFPSLVEMAEIRGGTCDHRYFLVTATMRSVGLPVAIDFTPQWTNYTGGHAWNVLLDIDSRMRPFNGGEDNFRFYDKKLIPMGDGNSICTKVYRVMFGSQSGALNSVTKNRIDISLFNNPCMIDVTDDYDFPKTRMVIKLDDERLDGKILYLSTYNYGWELNTVGWAIVRNQRADFQYVGLPAFYIPICYNFGNPSLIHKPLVMYKEKEKRHEYEPDIKNKRDVRLYRKFAFSGEFIQYANDLKGAQIQVSDSPDFSESKDLCVISSQAKGYESIDLINHTPFRYIRLVSSDSSDIRLAELEFWGKHKVTGELKKLEGQILGYSSSIDGENDAVYNNAFDENIRSNFNARAGSWIGLDIGDSNWIPNKVWYLPRNNFNVIEQGHIYELFYLADHWVSLGKKRGGKYYLDWYNVPDNALLLLKNHTEGRQERIFMYDNDTQEQVWW